jgi:hypothetical protein
MLSKIDKHFSFYSYKQISFKFKLPFLLMCLVAV